MRYGHVYLYTAALRNEEGTDLRVIDGQLTLDQSLYGYIQKPVCVM